MTNPNNNNDDDDDVFEWAGPSKSQQKRDAHRAQELGLELTKLKPEILAQIPLTAALEEAIGELKTIKKKEALRRHHQLIGKLMRVADIDAITEAMDDLKENHDKEIRQSHAVEQWRDQLIQGDQSQMERFFDQYPTCDRQQIRQLVKSAQNELASQKAPTNARKLFKLIRSVMTQEAE